MHRAILSGGWGRNCVNPQVIHRGSGPCNGCIEPQMFGKLCFLSTKIRLKWLGEHELQTQMKALGWYFLKFSNSRSGEIMQPHPGLTNYLIKQIFTECL